ncbi:flagellar hook capping FlgD N-terminal domain-containing protein [Erwinia sp. P7711]|uniref:flagellar hook assembly protein FlgD n=1 Tax=Erwinia sp. P7711 TaxID=3141451 RepID=UPI003188A24C
MGSNNNNNNSYNATAATEGTSSADLMNNFMTLLVAQMQNQDPTNPMDNNQMTSQLAQFNTAAGVEKLNDTLNSVGTLVSSMQQMNASAWVGRTVLIEGKSVINNSDQADANKNFSFALDSDADNVEVTLTDKEGNAYRAELPNVKAGVQSYSLDDLSNFEPASPPEGTCYDVSLSATNSSGDAPNIMTLKKAKVNSVAFSSGGSLLELGIDGTATLGQVYEIE